MVFETSFSDIEINNDYIKLNYTTCCLTSHIIYRKNISDITVGRKVNWYTILISIVLFYFGLSIHFYSYIEYSKAQNNYAVLFYTISIITFLYTVIISIINRIFIFTKSGKEYVSSICCNNINSSDIINWYINNQPLPPPPNNNFHEVELDTSQLNTTFNNSNPTNLQNQYTQFNNV